MTSVEHSVAKRQYYTHLTIGIILLLVGSIIVMLCSVCLAGVDATYCRYINAQTGLMVSLLLLGGSSLTSFAMAYRAMLVIQHVSQLDQLQRRPNV